MNKIKSKEQAEAALADFKALQTAKKMYNDKMIATKESLREFSEKNRKYFDSGKLELETGTLRFAEKSSVELAPNCNFKKIAQDFPTLIKQTFSITNVKQAFGMPFARLKLQKMGMKLVHGEEFKIE